MDKRDGHPLVGGGKKKNRSSPFYGGQGLKLGLPGPGADQNQVGQKTAVNVLKQ